MIKMAKIQRATIKNWENPEKVSIQEQKKAFAIYLAF
jgi:hypothetical protein